MKTLSITTFRKLIQTDESAKKLLLTHPKFSKDKWKGRILRGMANGKTARQSCLDSYEHEKEYAIRIGTLLYTDSAESFYTASQINSSTGMALKAFTQLFNNDLYIGEDSDRLQ